MKRLLFVALLLIPLTDLAAQETLLVHRGTRVRVSAPSYTINRLIGSVVSLDTDTLVVLNAEDQRTFFAIPLDSITKFEVSQGGGILGERWKEVSLPGVLLSWTDLAVQEAPSIKPRDRVRIKVRSPGIRHDGFMYIGEHWLIGTVVSISADSLVLRSRGTTLAIPLSILAHLEVSRGGISRDAAASKGALIGLLIGGTVGSWLGHSLGVYHGMDAVGVVVTTFVGALIVGFPGALIGGGMGGAMGSAVENEKWEQVALPLRVSMLPDGGEYGSSAVRVRREVNSAKDLSTNPS